MDNSEAIKDLNKFLKGIHMGGTTFKDYIEKVNSPEIKEEMVKIVESFKRHEEAITNRIEQLGGDAADSVGVIAIVGEIFQKVKLLSADTDEEFLKNAINAMEMGIEKANEFISEHEYLEETLKNDVKGVVKDYDNHLRRLKSLA